jgi:ribosomal protein L40E
MEIDQKYFLPLMMIGFALFGLNMLYSQSLERKIQSNNQNQKKSILLPIVEAVESKLKEKIERDQEKELLRKKYEKEARKYLANAKVCSDCSSYIPKIATKCENCGTNQN